MASGKSLQLSWITGPTRWWVHQHKPGEKRVPYRNPHKDRTLAGKARRRARRAAR